MGHRRNKFITKKVSLILGIFLLCSVALYTFQEYIIYKLERLKTSYVSFITHAVSLQSNSCLKHPKIVYDFHQFMLHLYTEAVLIEPSILFCLLPSEQKDLLEKRRYIQHKHDGAEHVIHFGLIGDNSLRLSKIPFTEVEEMAKRYNFQYADIYDEKNNNYNYNNIKTHYIFKRADIVIHAVVFWQRNNYLMTSKLFNVYGIENLEKEKLLYSDYDSAYEKFNLTAIKADNDEGFLTIPENSALFLHQLDSSKFVECNMSRSLKLSKKDIIVHKNSTLKIAFENALNFLKYQLEPKLIDFFLSSGTLLGWYRQCNLIPYTHDIDFGASSLDSETADYWINTFANDQNLQLILIMGLPEEAFELRFRSFGKSVDLFFTYDVKNITWTPGHHFAKGYYFWYVFPQFTLCSADLLGYKVLVPCEAEDILVAEYGKHWDEPKRNWYYDTNPKNMGPNIFWSDEKKIKIMNISLRLEDMQH